MAKDIIILNKRYLSVLVLLILGNTSWAQCLTSSLIINTGYNTITAAAIPGGANGATPVPDPHWIVTAISAGTSAAIAATPIPGLTAVVPGGAADIITPITGSWVANPAANPGGWISCVNSNTYNDPGTGVALTMTLGRPFRMCTDDSVRFSFNIASDNFTSAANVDGTIILPAPVTAYAAYTVYTQTLWLTAGTHTINIVVNNQNVTSVSSNPTGLNVWGTIGSATGTNSIVSESYASCGTYVCGSTCNTLALADSLHLCEQTTGSITATMTGPDPILSIVWSPVTGLSSSTILNPTIAVGSTSGYYNITVQSLRPYNLVNNGNFSLGNTGFSSTYTYLAPPAGTLPEGRYSVHTNPNGVHSGFTSFGDHTTGTGLMMILNGSPTPTSVWCQTIPVTPNTDYDFSSWFANCSASSSGAGAPILQFMVNGILIGVPTTVTAAPGVWTQFHTVWNSGASTTAQICIYDNNTAAGGNDFVIDDISFQQICTAKDSIYVDVNLVDTTYQHTDDSVCAPMTTTTLTAPPGYSSYLWNTGAVTTSITVNAYGAYWVYAKGTSCNMLIDTILVSVKHVDTTFARVDSNVCASATSVTLVAPPGYTSYTWNTGATGSTLTVTAAGNYWVYAPGPCTMLVDTFRVTFNPLPVINLGNDTGFCAGNTIILYSSQPLGSTYVWSTGSTTDSIHVSATGTYWLRVENGCEATDTINILVNPAPVVDLGPDTNNCQGNAVPLQSTITYTGATYIWSTGATTPSITVTTTGKYWLQVNSNTGCSGADTINVEILYDTVTLHTNDTAICKGQSMQVNLTGNPYLNTYQWLPTTGIANPIVGNPTIFGDTSAMYIVRAFFPGCPDIVDSFFLDVQPNPVVLIDGPRARAVCQFDTLHLHVAVLPGWYPHYIYSWTPSAAIDFPDHPYVVFTPGDSTSLVVDVSTSAGCRSADSVRIAVHPGNFAHVDSIYNVCPNDSVQLLPGGGVSYSWTPILSIDSPSGVAPWVHPITSEIYTVVATSEYGCTDTLNVWITVQPAALIFLEDSVQLFPGESYHIEPQTNCSNFLWWPTTGLKGRYLADPVVTPEVNTKYIVNASTEYGCTVVDSIIVRMSDDALLDMPNAFAPGNGPNNLFKIIKRGIATLNYFRIYDRWGVMVYESKDIDAGWDGTYKGKPQPFGVFVYQIEAVKTSGKTFRKQGNVTLVR